MKKLIIFFVFIFFFTSCEKDVLEPIEPVKTDPTEIQTTKQVMICHVQSDGTYIPMGINIVELNTHIAQGDYVADEDLDGYTLIGACFGSRDDCNDNDPKIYPGAEEICGDGIDNNCDGNIDEDCSYIPILLYPDQGAEMDNGCQDRSDPIEWNFTWEEIPGASRYHLYVRGRNATIPLINLTVPENKYRHYSHGSYIIYSHRFGWYWKVRAHVNGSWTDWSETRTFDAEPLNTDCSDG